MSFHPSELPSRDLLLPLAIRKRCSIEDLLPRIEQLSVENAKKHISFLLKNIEDITDIWRDALDAVIVHILDQTSLLGNGVTSDEELTDWLNSSHDYSNQSPLLGVIHRIASVVSDGEHIRDCVRSLIVCDRFLAAGEMYYPPADKDLFCYRVLAQLLRKTANGKPFPELFDALGAIHHSSDPIVLDSAAEMVRSWPSVGDEPERSFQLAVVRHIRCLNDFRWDGPRKQPGSAVAESMRPLRTWIEVGLAVKSTPYGGCTSNSCLAEVLKLLLCEDREDAIKRLLTLALWMSTAGARLDIGDDKQRKIFDELGEAVPVVREVVLTNVPCLQQICARTIRYHLKGSISEGSRILSLPVILQRYVAEEFLDKNLWRVDELADIVVGSHGDLLPIASYSDWRTKLLDFGPPRGCNYGMRRGPKYCTRFYKKYPSKARK